MKLSPLYWEWLAENKQQGIEEGLQQGLQQLQQRIDKLINQIGSNSQLLLT